MQAAWVLQHSSTPVQLDTSSCGILMMHAGLNICTASHCLGNQQPRVVHAQEEADDRPVADQTEEGCPCMPAPLKAMISNNRVKLSNIRVL